MTQGAPRPGVHLEPWGPGDLHLLERTMGDPEMTRYLGGPEDAEQLAERHIRYQDLAGDGRMRRVVDDATGEPVGSVGCWEKEWRGDTVWETGWFVLPASQGRGIATAATALVVAEVRAVGRHRFLHAFLLWRTLPRTPCAGSSASGSWRRPSTSSSLQATCFVATTGVWTCGRPRDRWDHGPRAGTRLRLAPRVLELRSPNGLRRVATARL